MQDQRETTAGAGIDRRRLLGGAIGLAAAGVAVRAWPGGTAHAAAQPLPGMPDAQMQAVLDAYAVLAPLPLETLVPRQARELPGLNDTVAAVATKLGVPAKPEMAKIKHRIIPGGPGSEGTLVRIYTPAGTGPFSGLVYFHGGGWVIANLNVYDGSARALAAAANHVVVSVAYRQAPENPYPAAVDDAYAAYAWALENATSFNGNPGRVAVAGESAGGNLATVTATLARDRGLPQPHHQLLVYPVVDLAAATEYPSAQQYFDAVPLSTPALRWFGSYYLPTPAAGLEPTASPLRAPSLRGLAPATIIGAEIDPLRDQSRFYADALQAAGVSVLYRNYEGVTHEFFGGGAVIDKAKDALALAASRLQA